MSTAAARRTSAQNRTIWVLVGRLRAEIGLSKDDAEGLLKDETKRVSGQEHSSSLSPQQAGVVIEALRERLEGRQPRRVARAPRPTEVTKVITPAQQKALSQIREALGLDDAGYRAFCLRMSLPPWPQTAHDAVKVYEGLEALLRRSYPRAVLVSLAHQVEGSDGVSGEDLRFARSIIQAGPGKRPYGAGQIGILLKLCRRYHVPIPTR